MLVFNNLKKSRTFFAEKNDCFKKSLHATMGKRNPLNEENRASLKKVIKEYHALHHVSKIRS